MSDASKKRAQRVTVVSASLSGGGAERVAVDLCCFLRDAGREVTLLTLTGDDPDAYRPPEGVPRVRIEVRRAPPSILHRVWYLVGRVLNVRRTLIAFQPDVVVSLIDRVNMLVLVSLFGAGIPVIASERIHPGYNPIARFWLLARQVVYLFAAAVTVQTKDGAEWFKRHSWIRHPVVVPNAARSSRDFGARISGADTVTQPFVLAVGRLTEQKGFDLLLNAFHMSGLVQAGWRLAILGEGPDLSALRRQAAALGMVDAVIFPGFVDVGPWLEKADIFVMSSRYEGFPNALMEAMQMGRACISFDCPSGPRDLIEDGQNGLLVPALDVTALNEGLQRLAADSSLRKRLGGEASKINERLAPARVYGIWLSLIDVVATGDMKTQSISSFADASAASWRRDRDMRRSRPGKG